MLQLAFGGKCDNEYVLRSMVLADHYWLFNNNREELICMVNDIIEELLDLDMEPKTRGAVVDEYSQKNMRTVQP